MNRWLRALLPYGLLLVIGGPLALILRDYYRDPSRHAGALSWAHPQVWVLSAAGLPLAWVGFHLGRSRGAAMGFSRVGVVIGEHFLFLVVADLHVVRAAQQNGATFVAAQHGDVVAVANAVENLHE